MKTTLKTILYCLILTIISNNIFSQNDTEIGITTSGLTDYDLLYKKQKGENKWFRLRGSSLNFGYRNVEGTSLLNLGVGIGIGTEHRVPIGDDISFLHGPEFFVNLAYQLSGDKYNLAIAPGFGYLLGFRYELSSKFSLSVETRPSIRSNLQFRNSGSSNSFNLSGGFNSNAVSLGMAYRFKPVRE